VEVLKDRAVAAFVVGQVIIAQSVVWPYVRVQPGFTIGGAPFEPNSLRGFETAHGLTLLGAAIVLSVLATLLVMGILKETRAHSWVTTGVMVGYVILASVLADARPTALGVVGVFALAGLAASILSGPLMAVLGDRVAERLRRPVHVTIWTVVTLAIALFIIEPLFADEARPAWLVLALTFALLGGYMTVRPPSQIGSYRMLLVASTGVMLMAFTMASSLRVTLQERQAEIGDAAAGLTRIQATYGLFIAWVGCMIAFGAAYSMWGRRRDHINAQRRQRRVEKVAAELERQLHVGATER
jgi:hypothetical protein